MPVVIAARPVPATARANTNAPPLQSTSPARAVRAALTVAAVLPLLTGGLVARADVAATAEDNSLETITVTARKRSESLAEVPASITVFTSEALQAYNIQSFTDYATKSPNLAFTFGGGPTGLADARTISIRGVTGQNLFGTGGATGFYIDDTPVPGSIDPRVLDIANIEVLKGPQGTLFGESSLGGNVRLITKRPDFTQTAFGYMAEAGMTSGGGSADGGGDVGARYRPVETADGTVGQGYGGHGEVSGVESGGKRAMSMAFR